MRLWSYQLIESGVLPDKMLVSQWRECIAIKRQWEKGTLKHRLVSYVKEHSKMVFLSYVQSVAMELSERHINYQDKYLEEIIDFCFLDKGSVYMNYPEHNDRYLKQCLYNLQEKTDRGIITKEEWQKIEDKFGGCL